MNSEYLSDYASKEEEEKKKTLEIMGDVGLEAARTYYKSRYQLREPLAISAAFESIWPQIPLYGTLIIRLSPLQENRFGGFHGFEARDVNRLVDFARDTRRVAFVLEENPREYADLNFLDPIFSELKPRKLLSALDSLSAEDIAKFKLGLEEFDALAGIRFNNFIKQLTSQLTGRLGPSATYDSVISGNRNGFSYLKMFGYEELTDFIGDVIVDDPQRAIGLISLFRELVTGPRTGIFGAIQNVGRTLIDDPKLTYDLPKSAALGLHRDRILPVEIGKFLMNKLTLSPDSFEGCRDVCLRYDQTEIQNTIHDLEQAVTTGDRQMIQGSAKTLSDALDQIWAESNVYEERRKLASVGIGAISIAPAIVGTAAGGIAGVGGLLMSAGLVSAEKILDAKSESMSDRLAKFVTPNYLVNVFKFKKTHNLT